MVDANIITAGIAELRQGFHAWRFSHWPDIAAASAPDQKVREEALRNLSRIFTQEGAAKIGSSFSRIVALQSNLASAQGTTPGSRFFHEDDAIGMGIETLRKKAAATITPYLAFKAKLNHRTTLLPTDLYQPVGSWGEEISWPQTQRIAAYSLGRIGLRELADRIVQKKTTGPGQAQFDGFEDRLQELQGLQRPRIATHELGHAVHFTLADSGAGTIDPTVSEIVSTFAEALFVQEMAQRAHTPKQRMALLSDQLNNDIENLEQLGKFSFEKQAYRYAKEHPGAAIPVAELWREASLGVLGESLNTSPESLQVIDARMMLWDQYMHRPGYGAGYVVGWAAAPALMQKLEADPEGFRRTFRTMMERGNNLDAQAFLKAFDIDISQPSFWNARLEKMTRDIDTLKEAHKKAVVESFVSSASGNSVARSSQHI